MIEHPKIGKAISVIEDAALFGAARATMAKARTVSIDELHAD
jgi:hypothetical protein